jgi:hypothetical protein
MNDALNWMSDWPRRDRIRASRRWGWELWFAAAVAVTALLAGCASVDLRPESISLETEHVSHATQHEPFTSHPTSYGINTVDVMARWEPTRNTYVEVSEGAVLEHCVNDWCGSLAGPREVFTARAGVNLWHK